MDNKLVIKRTNTLFLLLAILAFALSVFYNDAFVPSFLLMLALFLFGLCYYNGSEKKTLTYTLFTLGVALIIASLVYTFMRIL